MPHQRLTREEKRHALNVRIEPGFLDRTAQTLYTAADAIRRKIASLQNTNRNYTYYNGDLVLYYSNNDFTSLNGKYYFDKNREKRIVCRHIWFSPAQWEKIIKAYYWLKMELLYEGNLDLSMQEVHQMSLFHFRQFDFGTLNVTKNIFKGFRSHVTVDAIKELGITDSRIPKSFKGFLSSISLFSSQKREDVPQGNVQRNHEIALQF